MSLRAATFVVELALQHFVDWNQPVGRKALSVVAALRLTLCRLRRNATYQDQDFGVGLTTAWDYHQMMIAFLADVFGTSDETDLSALIAGRVCLIGCWSTCTAGSSPLAEPFREAGMTCTASVKPAESNCCAPWAAVCCSTCPG